MVRERERAHLQASCPIPEREAMVEHRPADGLLDKEPFPIAVHLTLNQYLSIGGRDQLPLPSNHMNTWLFYTQHMHCPTIKNLTPKRATWVHPMPHTPGAELKRPADARLRHSRSLEHITKDVMWFRISQA